jgi:hypothetical protein
MTEHNIFCYSRYKVIGEEAYQQERWRAFNKEVGMDRYKEIKMTVHAILQNDNSEILDIFWDKETVDVNYKNVKSSSFWESITPKQWAELLAIPEAVDFKEGFEYISGVYIKDEIIDNTVITDIEDIDCEVDTYLYKAISENRIVWLDGQIKILKGRDTSI